MQVILHRITEQERMGHQLDGFMHWLVVAELPQALVDNPQLVENQVKKENLNLHDGKYSSDGNRD
jgi:hypothetical protein